MARMPQDVTDAELGILQILWDQGSATIRQLTDTLYPGGGTAHYATVQKLLERLEAKGYVERDRSANVHVFSAAVDKDELIGRRLQSLAEKLCGGSLTPLLSHLLQSRPLSAEERSSLRLLIDGPCPQLRDPTFEIKYRRLLRAQREYTERPTMILMTGSSVTNDGFHGNANEVVKRAIESTEGFTFVPSGLEPLLEHGIELNLVADKCPDDCVKR